MDLLSFARALFNIWPLQGCDEPSVVAAGIRRERGYGGIPPWRQFPYQTSSRCIKRGNAPVFLVPPVSLLVGFPEKCQERGHIVQVREVFQEATELPDFTGLGVAGYSLERLQTSGGGRRFPWGNDQTCPSGEIARKPGFVKHSRPDAAGILEPAFGSQLGSDQGQAPSARLHSAGHAHAALTSQAS